LILFLSPSADKLRAKAGRTMQAGAVAGAQQVLQKHRDCVNAVGQIIAARGSVGFAGQRLCAAKKHFW